MRLGVPREIRPGEKRVATSPDVVRKLVALGAEVVIETGAGEGAWIPDEAFAEAGARIAANAAEVYRDADVVLKVQRPVTGAEGDTDELAMMKGGTILVGFLDPFDHRDEMKAYAEQGLVTFAVELIPRISRAQTMDALSSQSSLAGYRAVLDAATYYSRAMPMMMTAAGTIAPARVLVIGAGVAGLQAIATARRLGAIVSAYDVRSAVKEQIESLGAKFIEVEGAEAEEAETAGGYAREMGDDYRRRQAEVIGDTVEKQDIVICTALIPGKPAPVLVTAAMVESMKPGSVIVDLAALAGGNCELTEPGEAATKHGVTILGFTNVPSRVSTDASAMYARNLLNFITPMIDEESKSLKIDWEDEVIKGALVTRDGKVVNPALEKGEI